MFLVSLDALLPSPSYHAALLAHLPFISFSERSVQDLNQAATAEKAGTFLKSFERHEQTYALGGVFWPLAKWAHEGFDAEAIERLSVEEDIQKHNILGLTYRVKQLTTMETGTRGYEQGDELAFKSSLKKLMAAFYFVYRCISGALRAVWCS